MGGFQALFGWLTGHEQLLSALAALVVIGGVVVSPLGQGLRAILARRRTPAIAADEIKDAPPPMVEDRPSIAVLPFTNMSDDREQEFLADGMTEDVITGLALARTLFVIARNSTFSYKGKSPNVRDVGRELGVRYVLEGSVRRVSETLRVTVQLIDTRTGAHVWAQAIDQPLADIFKMQDEITTGIVATLTSHLVHAVTPEVARARPENLEAWELVRRANVHLVANMNAEGARTAESLLRTAVKKDPTYGAAWAHLAFTIGSRWVFDPASDTPASRTEAHAFVERAVRLAPADADVLAFKGGFLMFAGRANEAVPIVEQAIQLNPNEASYRVMLSRGLSYTGRPTEALAQLEAALRLSPRDPFMTLYTGDMAGVQSQLRRYAEAETWARRALAGGSRNVWTQLVLAGALAELGRAEEARDAVRDALRVDPEMTLARYEHVLLRLGYQAPDVVRLSGRLAELWPPALASEPDY